MATFVTLPTLSTCFSSSSKSRASSSSNIAGYGLTPQTVTDSISARNAVIPGGTMRTEGRNFPVQLSGEYKTEHDNVRHRG